MVCEVEQLQVGHYCEILDVAAFRAQFQLHLFSSCNCGSLFTALCGLLSYFCVKHPMGCRRVQWAVSRVQWGVSGSNGL